MAVKKSELYRTLWKACDEIGRGIDPAEYKNYVLLLLFFKYVSDKYKGEVYPQYQIPKGASFDDLIRAKGKTDIGERVDKIIQKFLETNKLQGILNNVSFNNTDIFGEGKQLVDKVTRLIGTFQNSNLDFKNNRASGDDIIGDAYEFLMMKFAQESGKSKGQFYTPSEVSRTIARLIGISNIKQNKNKKWTMYDPACGSGSLLIRAADEAPKTSNGNSIVSVYGQEFDTLTAGLAKMNLVLHNLGTGEIQRGNTLASPHFTTDYGDYGALRAFDFIVMNPPFSDKHWSAGLKPEEDEYGRFQGFGVPPLKNGDWAWFLHVIRSLSETGKGGIVMPHGILFRGNAEEQIRRNILKKRYIKGIVSLPANLFYGTGIPACIVIIDKENAEQRNGIFFIDASSGFKKDGDKNRLREQDIEKIVCTYNERNEIKGYSRFVTYDEILNNNDGNLNVPRYVQKIDYSLPQNVSAHLNGEIPLADINSLQVLWDITPQLKERLFNINETKNTAKLKVSPNKTLELIRANKSIKTQAHKEICSLFYEWVSGEASDLLAEINANSKATYFIRTISGLLLKEYSKSVILKKYDVFDILMNYWNDVMQDDFFLISTQGWQVGNEVENNDSKKTKAFEGVLIPKAIVENEFFATKLKEIEKLETEASNFEAELQEMFEEQNCEGSLFAEVLNAKGDAVNKTDLKKRIKELNSKRTSEDVDILQSLIDLLAAGKTSKIKKLLKQKPLTADYELKNKNGSFGKAKLKAALKCAQASAKLPSIYVEEYECLVAYEQKLAEFDKATKKVKEKRLELDELMLEKYPQLTESEIKDLVIEKKWLDTIHTQIEELFEQELAKLSQRVNLIAKRYETSLPKLEKQAKQSHKKATDALKRMGY